MPTHTKKPPNAPCLSPTPSGSHTMPQGGTPGSYDRSRQWAACPIGSRNPTTCGRLSASSTRRPRRSVSREDNLLLFDAGRDRVSRRAASRNSSYQRETPRPPASLRLGAAARSYGAPDTGNLRGPRPRAARVPIGQASVSRRIRRGRLRAVLDPLRNAPSRRKF